MESYIENDPEALALDTRRSRRCCVRWTEREYQLLNKRAWELHSNLSAMIRAVVTDCARRSGLDL